MHQNVTPDSQNHPPASHRSEPHAPSSKRAGGRIVKQVPTFSQMAVELAFANGGVDFIKMAATGTDPNVGVDYALNTEYWYAKATSVASMTSIAMTLASSAFTENQLDTFFSGFTLAFDGPQVVTQA